MTWMVNQSLAGGDEAEVAGFILKTFQILGMQQYSKIIYWSPTGGQFIIRDIDKFEELVLPRFFRHNKINSFVRQLNMYGFHKIKHNHFKSTFKHQHFQRQRKDLLTLIKRKIKQENINETPAQQAEQEQSETHVWNSKGEEQPTMANQKWANLTQQFLGTTKMINMSLIKVSCNDFGGMGCLNEQQEDCVSIEGQLERSPEKGIQLFDFQNPSCFLSSNYDIL